MNKKLRIIAVLAMTADGKIADYQGSAARFGSSQDKLHLEQQVALADGVIFGANTLRAYGTTMSVSNPELILQRKKRSQCSQPVQIVVSASANLDPTWKFFQQSIPRWLLTTSGAARFWQNKSEFERILITNQSNKNIVQVDWISAVKQLQALGFNRLAILGGSELIASLMKLNLIDELWLTICPIILGGRNAPTPVGGEGFIQAEGKRLNLLSVRQAGAELFLHYQIMKEKINN